jgi:hypothetical protein
MSLRCCQTRFRNFRKGAAMDLREKIRSIPHWPIDPVTFRDITTLLQDPEAFQWSCDQFYDRYKNSSIEKVVGIDARGFLFGPCWPTSWMSGLPRFAKKANCPHRSSARNIRSSTVPIPSRSVRAAFEGVKKWSSSTTSLPRVERHQQLCSWLKSWGGYRGMRFRHRPARSQG